MKVALAGQPNSGKSTLFNAVAGYRSLTSNFAGTTVEYTHGQARVGGEVLELIDLPGLYSLTPTSAVEEVSRDYLLAGDWDVIVNVLDASQLARSLELTLELLDLESPLVVCLNMMDEAARKGMTIDTHALGIALGVPVVEAIGVRGRGIIETFHTAQEVATGGDRPHAFIYAPEVEGVVEELAEKIAVSAQGQPAAIPKESGAGTEESGVRSDLRTPMESIGLQKSESQESGHLPALDCAEGPLECGGLTPPWNKTQEEGGAKPPHSKALRAISCAVGDCSTACSGHTPATEGPQGPRVPTALAEPAAQRPAVLPPTDFQAVPFQSPITNHQSPILAFPPARFRALQWVQSDPAQIRREEPEIASLVEWAQAGIAVRTGQPADAAVSAARHAACLTLFERVARVARPRADWREQVDRLAMHPVWGYAVLMGVFLGFFRLIFDVGRLGEARILTLFDALVAALAQHMNAQSALYAGVKGAVLGTAGAVAIVLPYLLPFLVGLAILEDIGYLSRVGYLMDAAMHRVGLHGTATLPILVGYGCSVPAVMATRILTTRRDRFIAAFLAVLVPCSARMTVIFALVGFYLGANYALGIYVLNIIVVALSGHLLARLWPEISPGMLMEVPAYRVPAPRVVALKTWWRLREFVLVAFPLLVVGSVVLSLVDYYGWQHGINAALSPLTALLGLPRSVGLTLIFGVLRKELSLLMLMQALGTTHVLGAMTAAQILIFTLFVTFYLPCMATLASMIREIGWRLTLAASTALLALAIVVSLGARAVMLLF
ncbi:MAG: ferrous iron transporter B [Terriglobia bacterium]